ncbi:MAG: ATP-binding protein [Burkholderiales bacterium]
MSLWLALAIATVALAGGAVSFAQAFHEAIEAQDDQLAQIAALVERLTLAAPQAQLAGTDDHSDARIAVQLLGAAPTEPASELGHLPDDLPDGLQTTDVRGKTWRLYVTTTRAGERVAIGQRTELRDDLAAASAWRTAAPLLLLIPLSLLLVALAVNRALAPLAARAAELDRRAEQDLRAVDARGLPAEVQPFVNAINQLLRRVANSVDAQTRFVADAAHELRSPLTALSLQAERAQQADSLPTALERIGTLRQGLKRARQLVEQLLALARAQGTDGEHRASCSLRAVLRGVIEDLLPLADAKAIDLGLEGEADAWIRAGEVDLKTLIANLVDNAIRYTPPGGRINMSITQMTAPGAAARPTLIVEDSGPGIDPAERERVFDPFYRVLGSGAAGSGLGLSIVRTIAARIGAEVSLQAATTAAAAADRDGLQRATGLRVVVLFAAAVGQPA